MAVQVICASDRPRVHDELGTISSLAHDELGTISSLAYDGRGRSDAQTMKGAAA